MNGDSPTRRALWIAALVVVVLAIVTPPETERASSANLSSHVVGDGGGRGLYLVLEQLGVSVSRWQRPLAELPRGAAVALLAPRLDLDDDDADRLVDRVVDGGLVVYVPPHDELDAFGVRLGLELRAWSGEVEVWSSSASRLRDVVADLPARLDDYGQVLDVEANAVDLVDPLVADDTSAVAVARFELGRGAVLVPTSDPDLATNASLAELAPTSVAIPRLVVAALEGRALVFDEYHHGYQDGAGAIAALSDWLVTTRPGRALLALLAVAVLALLAAGWRFGRPLAPAPSPSRSSLEHVEALADAFVGARASARPARLLVEGLRRRWKLTTTHDLERRLDALAARVPELTDDIALIRRGLPPASRPSERAPAGELRTTSADHDAPHDAIDTGREGPSTTHRWTDRHALDRLCAAIDRVADAAPRG